jgi:hypothetical protein
MPPARLHAALTWLERWQSDLLDEIATDESKA